MDSLNLYRVEGLYLPMSKTFTRLWLLKSEEERETEIYYHYTSPRFSLVNYEECKLLESNLTNH